MRAFLGIAVVVMSARADDVAAPYWWHTEDPTEETRLKLYNGIELPRVGYGCAGRAPADRVKTALDAGARLLDTAQAPEWYDEAAAAARAITKLHGAFRMHFLCAQHGARVVLNVSAKFWRISSPD